MIRLAGFLLLPLVLFSQPDFFGYFESEVDAIQTGVNHYTFGYYKFRLDIEARPNENVLIGANLNIQQYWGQTSWNLFDFLPDKLWKPIFQNDFIPPEYWVTELPYSIPDTILLDNMYMRASFSFFDLTVGRQQLSPGVGYAWNPTDIFNSKTLLDPSYEQSGVNAFRLELPLANRMTISTILKPDKNWDQSTKQIFLKSGIGSFDIELTEAQYDWNRSFLGLVDFQTRRTRRTLLGGSIVGEIFGWGIWSEGAYNELDNDDNFNEILLGIDHTFDNSAYLLLEVLHNENGIAESRDLTFNAFLQSLAGETHSLMQDYGFLYFMHPTFDYISLSVIAIANFNDRSGTFGPQIDWNIFEDTNLSFQGNFSTGSDDSEFGLQDWGFRLRLLSSF